MKKITLYYSEILIDNRNITDIIKKVSFFSSNFKDDEAEITATSKYGRRGEIIKYRDILKIELSASRRIGSVPPSRILCFDYSLDIILHLENRLIYLEVPPVYDLIELFDFLKVKKISFYDTLGIYELFKNEIEFKERFYNYINDNYEDFLEKYNLTCTRFGFDIVAAYKKR